jgi:hypothetical protein
LNTGVFTLLGFVEHLHRVERDMKVAESLIIAKACEMVANAAKEALGTYEFGWVSLAPETTVRKMRGDSLLLETGELRDSVQWAAGRVDSQNGGKSRETRCVARVTDLK